MLDKYSMQQYCKQYHKEHYVSDTTTRDKKTKETLGKILTIVMYFANEAGKEFKLEMFRSKEVSELREQGWTEPFAIDQNTVAEITCISRPTVSRWLTKLENMHYIMYIGQYTFEGSTHPSKMYLVDEWTIATDFGEELDKNKSLCDAFVTKVTKDKSSSIKLNNKCMQKSLWQKVSQMIAEANEGRHEYAKVKFLVQNEHGDYEGGRYYSQLCSTKNPEKHEDSDRHAKVNEIFGTTDEKIVEIDINSMTYRTQYNLVHDKYLDIDEDVYYWLYTKMTYNPMSISTFKSCGARELIKKESMPINMEPRSVYCKTHMSDTKDLNQVKDDYYKEEIESTFNMGYAEFLNRLKEAQYQLLSVYDFDGDLRVFLGKMFFKYEAIVYYYMHEEFKALGIKTANVYDGWYFIEGTCTKELLYKVYHKAIDLTKALLKEYNHDLVKLYGKSFTLQYKIYKKTTSKKTERQLGTYDIPTTTKVETVTMTESAEEHSEKQNAYVESIIEKCKELEAQGKQAFY